MRITRLKIKNFRSIRDLELELGETTVLIGQNNAGKTAVLEALRIVLTRRWGQRGTGFTENDVHRPDDAGDPKTLPPVEIELVFEEPELTAWDPDMVAALEDLMVILPDGRNQLTVRVTCAWSEEKEAFEPAWQFLDAAGAPLPERRRAINLTSFFSYVILFWLGALRDAADEFVPRSGHWGRLLRSVRIPETLESEVLRILTELDARIIAADPKLAEIAELIGQATHIAIGESVGAARLNTLPMAIEEMLQRTGIVLRNETTRPWLPIGHHGQGLQSLAVIFLFQAAVLQQLAEAERPGVEAIFAIEEPEAHLHPQAARTLWEYIAQLAGQKVMTTHSPYFVQHVPLHDLRLARLVDGCTEVSAIPRQIASTLPWNTSVAALASAGRGLATLARDQKTGCVAAQTWFDETLATSLSRCYRGDADEAEKARLVGVLRQACRVLPSKADEVELSFHGRRIRGEIFFARRWILVEGVCEYLLVHALGKAFEWPIDAHGISVIDFQQSGNAGIYPALATAFEIPWSMIVDGDAESAKFRRQILDRGFTEDELIGKVQTLTPPNSLEDQLLADGHEALLRRILVEEGIGLAGRCTLDELRAQLKNRKTSYMRRLALAVASDVELAQRMPAPFVDLITSLKAGA